MLPRASVPGQELGTGPLSSPVTFTPHQVHISPHLCRGVDHGPEK